MTSATRTKRAPLKLARYATDPDELQRAIALHPSGSVAVDLETKGLHPHATADAAIGAVIVEHAGVQYILRELPSWWPDLLADASVPKIMHNAKFDLMWMIEFCPSPDGQVVARNIQDTMLKSQITHDYRTRSGAQNAGRLLLWQPNDLKSVLQENLGVEISKSIHHEDVYGEPDPETGEPVLLHKGVDWTGEWSPEMIDYMLEDISYLAPLNAALDKKILAEGQERASWIEQDAVFATAFMTLNGIKPDVSAWKEAVHGIRDSAGNLVVDAEGVPVQPGWIQQHHDVLMELIPLWPGVENFNSPKQLVESSAQVLGGRLHDTRKATLKQLAGSFPAVAKLLEQRHLATRLKNWGPHYLEEYVCSICQRFHPGWNQIGTETSRPSANRPNLLQIPRAAEFRALFRAEEGSLIASLDYSAIEVLVAGVFANEPRLIDACATGDPHLATARMITGNLDMTKKSHPDERQMAKIANFGLLFGGGRDGLITQARDLFDTILTPGQAEMIIQQYFRLYPRLRVTKDLAYRAMEVESDRITVTNRVGLRRYLEGFNRKPTSWLNTWIQSTAQAGMKSSFRYLNEAKLTSFILGQIYDEILFEFPEECAEDFAARAKACMIRGMKDVLGENIPVIVDVNIGRTWL
jgi:DNA polymerase I